MADDDVLAARFLDHAGGDLAGEGALALPVDVLRGNADVRIASGLGRRMNRRERRRHHNFSAGKVLEQDPRLFHEDNGFVNGLEHLPVAGDEWKPHTSLLGG